MRPRLIEFLRWFGAAACLAPVPAVSQQPTEWARMARMELERQFAGPFQDTVIQRWRDPADGTICYLYVPISASHPPPNDTGYVQYGANTIGSISCFTVSTASRTTTSRPVSGSRVPAQR